MPYTHKRSNSAGNVGKVKAVILVGGPTFGTRFRPLSLKCPKPLFPVAGKPMIYHHVKACLEVEDMTEVLLIGTFQDHVFADFIRTTSRELGIQIRYLREYEQLGTAGGLYHFRDQILRASPRAFFVMHCDLCADFSLPELLKFHSSRGNNNHASLLSVESRKEQAMSYGCMIIDGETSAVTHYVEKPDSFISTSINGGIYCLNPGVFDLIKEVFFRIHDEPMGTEQMFLEKDVIPELMSAKALFAYKSGTFWSQIKSAASAIYASRHYLSTYDRAELASTAECSAQIKGDVIIHPSAEIDPTATIGPNVTVGPSVIIRAGARVRDSIILQGVTVEAHACVLNSIVGWHSQIGEWARIEGTAVDVNPNDPSTQVASKPLFGEDGRLEPSITIVGEDVRVRDEVLVRNSIVLPHKEIKCDYNNEIIL